MKFKTDPSVTPRIDITPLIDVILMLVIFFMITTTFVSFPGVLVKLPLSNSTTITSPQGAQVMITAKGELYFQQFRVSISEMDDLMRKHSDKSILIIKADRAVSHGQVVEVMDHAKRSGFERLSIATTNQADVPTKKAK